MTDVVFVNNYPMIEASRLHLEGRYPSQHLWGLPALREAGLAVEVLPDEMLSKSRRLNDLTRHQLGNLAAERAAWRFIRRGAVGYAADPGSFAGLASLRSVSRLVSPIVAAVHPDVPYRGMHRRALRGYDTAITLSQKTRQLLVDAGRAPKRTLFLPWGPDLDFHGYVGTGDVGVVSTGKVGRDQPLLLRALAASRLTGTVFAGQWMEASPGVEVRVATSVAPYLDVLSEASRAAVIAIPLSVQDRLAGLTELNDALALAKPVVMTRNEYIDVDIEAVGCGIWVDPGDLDGWTSALSRLSADTEMRREMGLAGRKFAEQHWNAQIFGHGVVDALWDVLSRK